MLLVCQISELNIKEATVSCHKPHFECRYIFFFIGKWHRIFFSVELGEPLESLNVLCFKEQQEILIQMDEII